MKIFILAIGDRHRASSRLRVWDHVDWLCEQGHVVYTDYVADSKYERITLPVLFRIACRLPCWVTRFFQADAICVQETLWLAFLMPWKNLIKRRKVLFDFSDPIDMIGSPLRQQVRSLLFRTIVRRCDYTIVENLTYKDILRHAAGRVLHFYGPVNVSRYHSSRTQIVASNVESHVHIGWTGSPGTLRFIAPLFPILDDIAATRNIRLTLIGVSKLFYQFRNLDPQLVPWSEAAEFALVPSFDLGLFAIDQSEHSRRRGAGKLFIYMAAGVPFIGTARGIAADVMREYGIGFPVKDEEQWRSVLLHAIDNAALRTKFSDLGMLRAKEDFSYERYREMLCAHLRDVHAV